jgi:hypothetical protein
VPDATEIEYSSKHRALLVDQPVPDIDQDQLFAAVFRVARPYTMTSKEVMHALYQSVRYVCRRGVPGDFVECGVWRGGSSLLAGLTMRALGAEDRRLHLYDTFEGMTAPTDVDVDVEGEKASAYLDRYSDDGRWCYADLADVRSTFAEHGFVPPQVSYIEGDVLDTLAADLPEQISVLRLDTDWYESTKFELEMLYPRLQVGGVLIIDDYGHWEGARKAVDEFFEATPSILLNRVSYAVRVGVKV